MKEEVLEFIRVFQSPSNEILFTDVACYWFARILKERFEYSSIYYNPYRTHFATEIEDTLYDITGVISDEEDEYYDFELYCKDCHPREIDLIDNTCIKLKGGDL